MQRWAEIQEGADEQSACRSPRAARQVRQHHPAVKKLLEAANSGAFEKAKAARCRART